MSSNPGSEDIGESEDGEEELGAGDVCEDSSSASDSCTGKADDVVVADDDAEDTGKRC